MIDIKLIRENPELVKKNIKKKFQDEKLSLVDGVIKLDEKWRVTKLKADKLRAERNKTSEKINSFMKNKKKTEAQKLITKAKKISEDIEKSEKETSKFKAKIDTIMYKIPNMMHESVPIGKDERENVEIKKFGKIKKVNYEIMNHAELAEKLGGVDFDSARKVSGNGFYYLRGDLSRLHYAIFNYARDYMIEKGFEFVIPPFMIRSDVVDGVMSFEEKDAMMYKIEGEDLYLIGTSEHSMIGMFKDKKLNGKKFPYLMTSFSPCFRKEGGAHGLEEKGFYRVHQFEKQEMIVICEPKESYDWYDKMLNYSVEIFNKLNVPVRTLECCSGDLADLKAKSADIEAWSPRQEKYWEAGSCSNMEEAQARRLGIRYEKEGKIRFAHTLNNTVIASPRALIAVMENNQQKDGSIVIPEVLRPYMGGLKKIEMKK